MHGFLSITGLRKPYKNMKKTFKNLKTVADRLSSDNEKNLKACSKKFHVRRTKSWRRWVGKDFDEALPLLPGVAGSAGEVAFDSSVAGANDGFLQPCPVNYKKFAKFICVQDGCPRGFESCGPYCTKVAKPGEDSTCVEITTSGISPVVKLTVIFTIAMVTGGPVNPLTWLAVTYQVSRLLKATVWAQCIGPNIPKTDT